MSCPLFESGAAARGLDLGSSRTYRSSEMERMMKGFGTDLQLIRLNAYNSQYSAGQFNFDRTYTQGPDPTSTTLNGGNGLASLLLGLPVAGTITATNSLVLFQNYYSLIVQDD